MTDVTVVGAGLTGATIARLLTDAGKQVVVYERKNHLGGNVHDYLHESGIRVHSYGPHYFRTSSLKVWDFVNRFADWYPFEARVMTLAPEGLIRWPVQRAYLDRVAPGWVPDATEGRNFEESCLAKMPRTVYENLVKGYTEKQWGCLASSLKSSLAGRFDVREDGDDRLKSDRWQVLPNYGYTALVAEILRGISIEHGDWLAHRIGETVVFTGSIDEFFDFRLGHLTYRRQRRVIKYRPEDWYQQVVQINNPGHGADVRRIEWKHMMRDATGCRGTVLTTEYPEDAAEPCDYEYPMPGEGDAALYQSYRVLAEREAPNVTFAGRLGEYRYLDMDMAIARAMTIARRLT